jgi:hypothetical protein
MKRTLTFLTLFGMVLALSTAGLAGENVQTGFGERIACTYGSCFAPNYNAEGEVAVFKGKGASAAEAADCCIDGDTYKLIIKSAVGKDKVKWTSAGTLNSDCGTGPYADSRSVSLADATKVKLKAIALPGGVPAGAYVRINASGWGYKKGFDGCGF